MRLEIKTWKDKGMKLDLKLAVICITLEFFRGWATFSMQCVRLES